MDGVI